MLNLSDKMKGGRVQPFDDTVDTMKESDDKYLNLSYNMNGGDYIPPFDDIITAVKESDDNFFEFESIMHNIDHINLPF